MDRVCAVCGGPMDGRPPHARYCGPECDGEADRSGTRRTSHEMQADRHARRADLAEMWEDGLSLNEIAAHMGITRGYVGVMMARMRADGWQLSYRRPTYAAHPFDSGTWAERRQAMSESRVRQRVHERWGSVLRRDPCAYCGAPSNDVDHIVPLARDGEWGASNLIGACKSCNSSKQARPLLAFLILRRIDEERRPWVEVYMR